jgi:hypothetical protein
VPPTINTLLCLSPNNIAGDTCKRDSVAAHRPIDRNQKAEANAVDLQWQLRRTGGRAAT